LEKGNHIGIYSKNRMEWFIAYLAASIQSYVIVPIYDTLGPDAVKYIANHADLSYIVCSGENYDKLLESAPDCPHLKIVVLMDQPTQKQIDRSNELGLNVVLLESAFNEPRNTLSPTPPHPDDLFCIMYTSGTTGVPKGVMLTHCNAVSAITCFEHCGINIDEHDIHLSYLPLAHIMEMMILLYTYSRGAQFGFWHGEIKELIDDIQTLRPTILVGVPRVFNRIYDKINAQLSSSSFLKKNLFQYGYNSKITNLKETGNDASPFWNKLIFSKLTQLIGGRVRLILSGSAPLAPNVQDFLRICFCCKVIQGYGLTETCAAATASDINDWKVGHVGPPLVGNEIKLVDVPEMNYISSKKPQKGEVCVRGNTVFKGYYKMADKTEEVIDKDGWFHTGDVGQWNANGTLSIIDRKKNIFKLAQGEYVAAEYLEAVYLRSKFVGQIFVYGNSFKNYLVAIVVPDEEVLIPFARHNNIQGDMVTLCKNEIIKRAIFSDIMSVANSAKLKGFEKIKNIYLEPEPWTTENGILTPTMKVKRNVLQQRYEAVIDQLYNEEIDENSHSKM